MFDRNKITCVKDIVDDTRTENPRLRAFWNLPGGDHAIRLNFPFGIWYRGHSSARWPLIPRVFRNGASRTPQTAQWDETSMVLHFQQRATEQRAQLQSQFEWLCLMQHYELPTRLLDWTESALIALYFAVADERDSGRDGRLFVLNARYLNYLTDKWYQAVPTLYTPTSHHVALRARMSECRTMQALFRDTFAAKWVRTFESMNDEQLQKDIDAAQNVADADKCGTPVADEERERYERIRSWIGGPLAVYPARTNSRMIPQFSTFTLHGGKLYPKVGTAKHLPTPLPPPIHLEDLNDRLPKRKKVLASVTVPSSCKLSIKRHLEALGIHEGTLFPEIDQQAKYIKRVWDFSK